MNPVVAAIISSMNATGEPVYFLVQSKKDYGEYTGYWYPPGGKVEHGETDLEALYREIREELGVVITSAVFISESMGDITKKVTWWRCDIPLEQIKINTSEIAGSGFFTKHEMRKMPLWPATKQFFEAYIFV